MRRALADLFPLLPPAGWAGLAVVATLAAVWLWRRPGWMGFQGKTLWDWAQLLAVPAGVGLATVVFNASQMSIEQNRRQEAAVQAFVDRTTELMRADGPGREAALRAHTIAVMQIVDGPRAGRLLRFLEEMALLGGLDVPFERARLGGADLKGIDLDGADFENADLARADLEEARLAGADFEDADLRGADLKAADLRGADFEGALMARAQLNGADLRGADLSRAEGLVDRQIASVCVDAQTRLPGSLTATPGACGRDWNEDADTAYEDADDD